MAEGGEDIVMEPILPKMTSDDWAESKRLKNYIYDDNTQFNTDANLNSDPTFTRPSVATELIGKELTYNRNDKLKNSLEGTDWAYTNTGLTKLSPKIITEGNKLFYLLTDWEFNTIGKNQQEKLEITTNIEGNPVSYLLPLTKTDGKFYTESTLRKKYGTSIIKQIKSMLETPEENIPMVNQFPPSINQPQTATTAETSFTENIVNSPKPIDKIIDATEDELKSLGLTDHAIGELRGLIQAGDDLVTVKRDKDMRIEELEKRIAHLKKELKRISTTV